MEFVIVGIVCLAGLVFPIALARLQSQQRRTRAQALTGSIPPARARR